MPKINLLDKDLVNKIAAGEVVERPASVIKELIENSIDAGADSIVVEIKDAGTTLIKVTDNGLGMDKEDARMCIKSHATSKISNVDDLFSVSSLGFRGEALPSIAAVSSLKIITKQKDSSTGIEIEVEDGNIVSEKKVGASEGTSIIVSELFYNTPVRKKHLKSNSTEIGHITDIITRYSLSNKDLSFRLISNGKEIINSPKTGILNKIVGIYGKETAKQMIPLDYKGEIINLSGFIGKPYLSRTDKNHQSLFINGRYVRNQTISNAIYDAYHTLLFLDRNPVYTIFLEMDFSKTDVNVHPSKDIIRIENEDSIYEEIFSALRDAFQNNSLIPEVELDSGFNPRKPTKQYKMMRERQELLKPLVESDKESDEKTNESKHIESIEKNESDIMPKTGFNPVEPKSEKQSNIEFEKEINEKESNELQKEIIESTDDHSEIIEQKESQKKPIKEIIKEVKPKIGPVRILGQVNRLYIICETDHGLLIIDQHAAQERVYYEKFMNEVKEKKVIKQKLLRPFLLEVNAREDLFIKNNIEMFSNVGFDIEEHAPNTYQVRTVPKLLKNDPKVIEDILKELTSNKTKTLNSLNEEQIAYKACRKAIKAGDLLTKPEMYSLIEDLEKSDKPFACPHGRPTIINITLSELEKKFKRVGG